MTYAALFEKAASIAATLVQHEVASEPPLTAVFAYRSVTAFAGILGTLLRGHGYVPLNCKFPPDRTKKMLRSSGCRALVVDSESEKQLDQILEGLDDAILVILPEREAAVDLASRWPQHRFIGAPALAPGGPANKIGNQPARTTRKRRRQACGCGRSAVPGSR